MGVNHIWLAAYIEARETPGPEVKNTMLNSAEHEIFSARNGKMPTIVGIFNIYQQEKINIPSLSEAGKAEFLDFFSYNYEH